MRTKDFKICRLLGKGTYGAVYKVIRKSDNEEYALKEVSLKSLKRREREDAVNEVRVLASIQHRNILRYCDAFLEGSNLYIVTEYAKGGDLHGKIKRYTKNRKTMSEETVWVYLHQMAAGLDTLHSAKVLHRDLKPKNIFLTGHNQIRLGDLGCAKIMKAGMARTQIGTPYYMSPEIWEHRSYNAASDMWALGCIIFEMCTGRPPFLANDMQGLARKVRRSASPSIGKGYSRDLSGLVKRLLSKDPRHRPKASDILKMEPIRATSHLLPETPANSRWNHKNMDNYEQHVRHGVLSTIKIPRQNPRSRAIMRGVKLPGSRYPVRKIFTEGAENQNKNVGAPAQEPAEPMSSPIRPSSSPAKPKQARPSSAQGVRPRVKPARPQKGQPKSRRPSGRPSHKVAGSRASRIAGAAAAHNKLPTVRYDNRGHRISDAQHVHHVAGGHKRVSADDAYAPGYYMKKRGQAHQQQGRGYGGYRQVRPTYLW